MRILVTGAAGQVGSTVARGLRPRHQVRGHDRVPMPELDDTIVSDLSDLDALLEATRGTGQGSTFDVGKARCHGNFDLCARLLQLRNRRRFEGGRALSQALRELLSRCLEIRLHGKYIGCELLVRVSGARQAALQLLEPTAGLFFAIVDTRSQSSEGEILQLGGASVRGL